MRNFLLFLMISLSLASHAAAEQTIDSQLKIGQSTIHYGVFETIAQGERAGDILYFHGFGDRFSNHTALFQEFNNAGFRVLAFDLPSHGDSTGNLIGSIDFQSFKSLSHIAHELLGTIRPPSDEKPLILAGWSLGGLIATRILQVEELRADFPKISGLILHAPAFAPQKCVGTSECQITRETLSHNLAMENREIKPTSPLKHLPFAARMLIDATLSWQPPFPSDLQTLILIADNDDKYVQSPLLRKWVGTHRSNYVSRIAAYQCTGARHEVDNEPAEFGGEFVRGISRDFARAVSRGEQWKESVESMATYPFPCQAF